MASNEVGKQSSKHGEALFAEASIAEATPTSSVSVLHQKRHLGIPLLVLLALGIWYNLTHWTSPVLPFHFQHNKHGGDLPSQQEQSTTSQADHEWTNFSWSQIQSTKHLEYTPCFGRFQCARLDVPLNWNTTNHDEGPRASVAIIKLPAKVPVTDERYGGPILINPGGPGVSGVYTILEFGHELQAVVDFSSSPKDSSQQPDKTEKYFDIIGFDPRGVNNSTPRVKCFPDPYVQQLWDIQYISGTLSIGSFDDAFEAAWAKAQAIGESCSAEHDGVVAAKYVSSAQVVEDMVEIIEQHGAWREREAVRLLSQQASNDEITKENTLNSLKHKKGLEPLQFWGFSYGTVLGATFAATHPSRAHRIILDGVLNMTDWYRTEWYHHLTDTDKVISQLASYCFTAGREECPLATSASSPSDIEARLDDLAATLKRAPIPVPASEFRGPEIISHFDLLAGAIGAAVAKPEQYAEPVFALIAVLLLTGDGSYIADFKQAAGFPSPADLIPPVQCWQDGPFSDACYSPDVYDVQKQTTETAIACLDGGADWTTIGAQGGRLSKGEYKRYIEEVRNQSRWMGDEWSHVRLQCTGFTVRSAWTGEWERYFSPFSSGSSSSFEKEQIPTAHPLLLISNALDPVTPHTNAEYTAGFFANATVLTLEAEGHVSHSRPSLCVYGWARRYFQTGELPEEGSVCKPLRRPWLGDVKGDGDEKAEGWELGLDEAELKRLREVAEVLGKGKW